MSSCDFPLLINYPFIYMENITDSLDEAVFFTNINLF